MLEATTGELTIPRAPANLIWRRAGAASLFVGGVVLMIGGITPLGTLTSSNWCAVHGVSCYGAYSPSWLGLGNDPEAPQLGDWATYQGLVFVILGFLAVVLGTAIYRMPSRTGRTTTRRALSLAGLTLSAVGLLVFPELFGGGTASWPFYVLVVSGLIWLAVSWGSSLALSRSWGQIASVAAVGLAVLAVLATMLSWRSLEHFLGTWVTPHNDGWQSFTYAWQVALVPIGAGLVAFGSILTVVTAMREVRRR
jgi:hypothetical protein